MESEDPDAVIRDVGRRVAELRAGLGLTQEKLAEALNVSGVYVRRVEIGQENLTLRSLTRFATMLGVRTVDLLTAPQSREVRVGRPPRRPKTVLEAPPTVPNPETPQARPTAPEVPEANAGSQAAATPTEPDVGHDL